MKIEMMRDTRKKGMITFTLNHVALDNPVIDQKTDLFRTSLPQTVNRVEREEKR